MPIETIVDASNLKVNSLEVVQSMTKASWVRLNKSHNPIILRKNRDTGSGIRPECKLAKSLTEISNKLHEPKTYDEVINNLIHGNR